MRIGHGESMSMRRYVLLLPALGWFMGSQVLAHSLLQASSPMDGGVLEPPRSLELQFNEPVRLLRVRLTDTGGDAVPFGFEAAREPAATVEYDLPTLQPGEYTVQWTLIGQDGHTVSEQFSFSVRDTGA